jgi:hypothetical protein
VSEQSGKQSKRKVYALLAIIIILAAAAASYFLFWSHDYILHGEKETKITYIHSSSGTQTYTFVYENNSWTATYELGKTFTIHYPLYTNSTVPGTTNLTSVVCNTSEFSFLESVPVLPTNVPYASDISSATKTIDLVFQAPTTPYTGVFEITFYYDYSISP